MCENYVTSSVAPQIASASACSSAFNVSSTLERTAASTCPRSSAVSTRIASFNPFAVSSAMVASLWSGSWIASQLPLNQIEATASNVRKLRYGIIRQRLRRNGARTGGGASGSRWLDVPGAPDQARRARAEGPAADDVQLSGKRRSGWPNGLRGE